MDYFRLLIVITSIQIHQFFAKLLNQKNLPLYTSKEKIMIVPPLVSTDLNRSIKWPSVECQPMQNISPKFRKNSDQLFKKFFQGTDIQVGTGEFNLPPDSQVSIKRKRCHQSVKQYLGHQFSYYIEIGQRKLVNDKKSVNLEQVENSIKKTRMMESKTRLKSDVDKAKIL